MIRGSRLALVLRVSLLVALLGALCVGVFAVRGLVDRRMGAVRDSLLTYLQMRLGRAITYGQVSPSVFRRLAVTDLRIYSATDPTRVVLSIDRLSASYGLVRLLLTRDPLQALREIDLSGSVLALDYQADPDLFSALAQLPRGQDTSEGRGFTVPVALRVSGSELDVRLVTEPAEIGVSRLFFTISSDAEWLAVSLRCDVSGRLGAPRALAGAFQTGIAVRGKVARDLSRADLDLQLRSLVHDRISLRDQTFLLSYREDIIELTKIEDRAPVDLQLTIGMRSRRVKATFRTDSLQGSDLLTLRGEWQPYDAWLASTVSTRGTLSLNFDGTGLAYDAEIQAALEHPRLPAVVSIETHLSGDASVIEIRGLRAQSSLGSLAFDGDVEVGTWMPQGQLSVNGLETLLQRRVAGTVQIDRYPAGRKKGARLSSAALEVGALGLRGLSVDVTLGPNGAGIALTTGATGMPDSTAAPALALAGTVSWKPTVDVELSGSVRNLAVGVALAALGTGQEKSIGPTVARMELSSPLRVATDMKRFSVELDSALLRDPANPGNSASGSFSLANDGVAARSLEVSYLGQNLTGEGSVDLASGRAVGFNANVALNGVPFHVQGSLDANDLRFSGSYGLEGALTVFPFETSRRDMYFWIRSAAMPLPIRGLSLSTTLNLTGVLPADEDWFVTSTGSRATFRVPGSGAVISADMDFTLDHERVKLDRLALSDAFSTVNGSGEVTFVDLSTPAVSLDLSLAAPGGGGERYVVQGTVSRTGPDLRARIAGSPLARLGQKLIGGSFRGDDVTISGSWSSPALSASLALENGRFNRDPVTLSGQVTASAAELKLSKLRFTLRDHTVQEGEISLDPESGAFSIGGRYSGVLLRDEVRALISLSGTLPGYRLADAAALAFPASLDATLTVSKATVNNVPFDPWSVEFEPDGSSIVFHGGPSGILNGSLSRDRRLSVTLKDPFPIVGTAEGTVEGSRIDAALTVDRFDITALNSLLRSSIISFTQGTAATIEKSALTIYGPLNDPDIVGSLKVAGGGVRSPLSPDEATGIDTVISFGPGAEEEKGFALDSVTAPMGKGKVTAAARFTMDHWVPSAFDLKLTAEPPDGVHIVWRFGTVVVDGYGRGTIRVTHDEGRTALTSTDLVLQSSKLKMDFSVLDDAEEPEPYPLAVDMVVTTGRNVQFLWPAERFPILKATARQGSRLKVIYDGETFDLVIDGDVGVLGGDLFFFDRSFSIREGTISFQEGKLRIDPRVSMRAEIRERDEQNRDVRITLEADRVRLSELSTDTIRFSSDPAQPSATILAGLGQSIFSRTTSLSGESSEEGTAALPLLASLTGDVLSRVGLLSPVEDKVRDALGLDLLSIRTQVVQNILVDKADSFLSQGRTLDNDTPALGKYFGNTELAIGKYIGDDLFLEMMLRLETADADRQSGLAALTGLSPAFEISLEWDTPFFILDWSFLPEHPESLFLGDNTLGIRWRFSY